MAIKKHIPNFLTVCNLSCGIAGLIFLFQDLAVYAAIAIWAGAVFDFLDGFAARLLKSSSPIGKELDSLADMITFSLLPAFIVFFLMAQQPQVPSWLPYIAFSIAIFSALRLAKFNIDERQSTSFLGLPTPASALVVSALPFYEQNDHLSSFINPYSLAILSLVLSALMISEIRLFSLKFKKLGWKADKWRIIFLIFTVSCFIAFNIISLPLIVFFYIIFSVVDNKTKRM